MRQQAKSVLVVAAVALSSTMVQAADFVNQVFENGSLVGTDNSTNNGVAPTSAADQWHLWSVSGNNRAEIANTGRTFQTGTNGEALVYRVARPGVTEGDLEGATFHASTPYSILPGQVVYSVMETFADLGSLSASQLLKVDVRFGSAGNALDYGGFSNALPEWSINSNANTLASGGNQGIASVTSGSGTANSHFPNIKYDGAAVVNDVAASTAAFDKSYLMSTVYRPVTGGTNAEMTSADGVNPVRYLEGRQQTGGDPANTINTMHNSIDRVTIHFRRNLGTYDGVNASQFNAFGPLSAFPAATNTASVGYSSSIIREEGTGAILNPEELKLGIKSLRIGATWPTDINLDGVVNAADKAIVQANQSLAGATLLQGDVTNDGLVDATDLAAFASLLGDYNANGVVDAADYTVWQDALGTAVVAGSGADGNGNGLVDATDFEVWKGQFGQVAAGSAAVSAVPEPTGVAMALLAIVATSVIRRRQD